MDFVFLFSIIIIILLFFLVVHLSGLFTVSRGLWYFLDVSFGALNNCTKAAENLGMVY